MKARRWEARSVSIQICTRYEILCVPRATRAVGHAGRRPRGVVHAAPATRRRPRATRRRPHAMHSSRRDHNGPRGQPIASGRVHPRCRCRIALSSSTDNNSPRGEFALQCLDMPGGDWFECSRTRVHCARSTWLARPRVRRTGSASSTSLAAATIRPDSRVPADAFSSAAVVASRCPRPRTTTLPGESLHCNALTCPGSDWFECSGTRVHCARFTWLARPRPRVCCCRGRGQRTPIRYSPCNGSVLRFRVSGSTTRQRPNRSPRARLPPGPLVAWRWGGRG